MYGRQLINISLTSMFLFLSLPFSLKLINISSSENFLKYSKWCLTIMLTPTLFCGFSSFESNGDKAVKEGWIVEKKKTWMLITQYGKLTADQVGM